MREIEANGGRIFELSKEDFSNHTVLLEQNIKEYYDKEIIIAKEEMTINNKVRLEEFKVELSKDFQTLNLRILDIQK